MAVWWAWTVLSEYIVQKDGAVFGVAYTDNLEVEFMCAE